MKYHFLIIPVLIAGTITVPALFHEQDAIQPRTMPLVPMMRLLLSDIQQIDEGIYLEDYAMIEDGAEAIAHHPAMTEEDKIRIKTTLGPQMPRFVSLDMTVHHHADSMRLAAVQKNMREILRHYTIVQQGCVDCHTRFRDPVTEARLKSESDPQR